MSKSNYSDCRKNILNFIFTMTSGVCRGTIEPRSHNLSLLDFFMKIFER